MVDEIYICKEKWECQPDVLEVTNQPYRGNSEEAAQNLARAIESQILPSGQTLAPKSSEPIITDQDGDGFLELHLDRVNDIYDRENGVYYKFADYKSTLLSTGAGRIRFAEFFFTPGTREKADWSFPFNRHDAAAARRFFQKKYGGFTKPADDAGRKVFAQKMKELQNELSLYLSQVAAHGNTGINPELNPAEPDKSYGIPMENGKRVPTTESLARWPDGLSIWNCTVYAQQAQYILSGLKFRDGSDYFTFEDALLDFKNPEAIDHALTLAHPAMEGLPGFVISNSEVAFIDPEGLIKPTEGERHYSTHREFLERAAAFFSSLWTGPFAIRLGNDIKVALNNDSDYQWSMAAMVQMVRQEHSLMMVASIHGFISPSHDTMKQVMVLLKDFLTDVNHPERARELMLSKDLETGEKWLMVEGLVGQAHIGDDFASRRRYLDAADKLMLHFGAHGDLDRRDRLLKAIAMNRRDIDSAESDMDAFSTYFERKEDEKYIHALFDEICLDSQMSLEKKAQRLAHEVFGLLPYTFCEPLQNRLKQEDPILFSKVGTELVRQGRIEYGARLLGRAYLSKPTDLTIAYQMSGFLTAHGFTSEAQQVYEPFKTYVPKDDRERLMLGVMAANGAKVKVEEENEEKGEEDFMRARELIESVPPKSWSLDEKPNPQDINEVDPPDIGSFDAELGLLRAVEMSLAMNEQENEKEYDAWNNLKEKEREAEAELFGLTHEPPFPVEKIIHWELLTESLEEWKKRQKTEESNYDKAYRRHIAWRQPEAIKQRQQAIADVQKTIGSLRKQLRKTEQSLADLSRQHSELSRKRAHYRGRLESVIEMADKYLHTNNKVSPISYPRNTLYHLYYFQGEIIDGPQGKGTWKQSRQARASNYYLDASTYSPLKSRMMMGRKSDPLTPFFDDFRKTYFPASHPQS